MISVMLASRDSGVPLPAGGVCFSPWVDLECSGESMAENDHLDDFIKYGGLSARAMAYLGDADPKHPWASALHADLRGLPPMLIHLAPRKPCWMTPPAWPHWRRKPVWTSPSRYGKTWSMCGRPSPPSFPRAGNP